MGFISLVNGFLFDDSDPSVSLLPRQGRPRQIAILRDAL